MIHKKFDELRLTGNLPSPSFVGVRILKLTQRDDYLEEELTKLIMADPALSGRIIKLANAADAEGRKPVESVPDAAIRLGPETTRSVALGFTLISDRTPVETGVFDCDRYWSESLATAVAVQVLAREKLIYEPAEAFTCALLCDVGKLALATVHPETYSEILREHADADDITLATAEQHHFSITHSEVTAAMMADWGLPVSFQEAVLNRHFESSSPEDDFGQSWALVSLLQAGKKIAKLLCSEDAPTKEDWIRSVRGCVESARGLGMPAQEFLSICDTIRDEWESWSHAIAARTKRQFAFSEAATSLAAGEDSPESAGVDAGRGETTREMTTRILLVDDDHRMLRLMQHHLRNEEYEIFTAQSSEEGLQTALENSPQILITDWMMPGMTGVKLCETLRQTEPGRKMYVLIVTARENDEQVVEAFEAGADDYIVKPFNPRILLARVRAGQRMIRMRECVEESEKVRLRQVAELGVLTRRLRTAAMTDALTELPNRRFAIDRLKQEWENAITTGKPLSVIMVDIDNFKRVNDLHGHDVGDAVLRQVAHVLRSKSRSADVLCRLGGEEFLSINVGCDLEQTMACAERLRSAVEDHEMKHDGEVHRVTVSLGVGQLSSYMERIEDLLKASDEALYAAKENGRNVVFVLPGDEHQQRSA